MSDGGAQWRIGENVPWVVGWSGEQQFRLQPSRAFPGRVEVVQTEAHGAGDPVLSGMHLGRQRRAVVDQLCHVCGKPTSRHDRWLFPTATGRLATLPDGEVRYVNHTPPTHGACAELAATLCPHLRKSRARPLAFPKDAGRLVPETRVPDEMAALADRFPAVRAAMEAADGRLIFSYFRVHTAAFTRAVQRLRLAQAA